MVKPFYLVSVLLVLSGAHTLVLAQYDISLGGSMPPEIHRQNVFIDNQFVRVYNDGETPVTITGLEFDADPAFQLKSDLSIPVTVAPKEVIRWVFDFVPSDQDLYQGSFTVTSDAPDSPHTYTFEVTMVDPPLDPWRFVGRPSETSLISGVQIDPENPDVWYVPSFAEGLYITRDAGQTWERPIVGSGISAEGFHIDPADPDVLYAAAYNRLLRSTDGGLTWRELYFFDASIRSVLVSTFDGTIYAGPHWSEGQEPGVYRSEDGGATWELFPLGGGYERLICWDIEEDPNDGTLYLPTEIAHHPQPYRPPFFTSTDRGETWQEITGELPWHALKVQVDAKTGEVFVLTEGSGLYVRAKDDPTWHRLGGYFHSTFLLDEASDRFYAGHLRIFPGGIYVSDDRGQSFEEAGLSLLRVAGVAVDHAKGRIIVASRGAGLFSAPLPAVITAKESIARPAESSLLLGNYPNPVRSTTTITLQLFRLSSITLTLYNVLGRAVRTIASGTYPPGRHKVDLDTAGLPTGIYVYRLKVGERAENRMMVVRP